MHDLDQIRLEASWQHGQPGEYESVYADEYEGDFIMEPAYAFEGDFAGEYEGVDRFIDEREELELAAELLAVSDEAALDQFFGKLFRRAKNKLGEALSSTAGKTLIQGLKGIARQALPHMGQMVGGYLGGPLGGALGGQLASKGGQLLGLELEGLSMEDQEFEVARRVVRLAGDAVQKTIAAQSNMPADTAAKRAVAQAVRQHAPGLLPSRMQAAQQTTTSHSGHWLRIGKHLIIYNVY